MIVCEGEFTTPDPKHPETSQHEVDFYQSGDHRLSLRLRYEPRQFEIYKRFYRDMTEHIVWANADLQLALDAGGSEWGRRFSDDRRVDKACQHVRPVKAESCKVTRGLTQSWQRATMELS